VLSLRLTEPALVSADRVKLVPNTLDPVSKARTAATAAGFPALEAAGTFSCASNERRSLPDKSFEYCPENLA